MQFLFFNLLLGWIISLIWSLTGNVESENLVSDEDIKRIEQEEIIRAQARVKAEREAGL